MVMIMLLLLLHYRSLKEELFKKKLKQKNKLKIKEELFLKERQ